MQDLTKWLVCVAAIASACGTSDVIETRRAEPVPPPPAPIAASDEQPPPGAPPETAEPVRDPNAPEACPPRDEWPEGMACIDGGTFTLGSTSGQPDEREPGDVYVDTFYMDTHEVTNEAFAPCVESRRCRRPRPFRGFGDPQQPVVAVSWASAVAHCEMVGKRLPTEAEWERAAGGPSHTQYAWGDEDLGCERAAIKDEQRGEGCGRRVTYPVGSFEPGHFGLHDMTGNVHEWVYDWYSPCLRGCENECGDACFGRNPRGPCNGESPCPGHTLRSIRGGSWFWPVERARVTARRGSEPQNTTPHRFGFRCARSLRVDEQSTPPPVESGEGD